MAVHRYWLFALIVLFSLPLRADYDSHFQQGRALYRKAQYREALRELNAALNLKVRPGAQYYKALTLIKLKRFAEARGLLLKVRGHPKTPQIVKSRLPSQLALIDRELRELKRKTPGRLVVKTPQVTEAQVLLNGKLIGLTPLSLPRKPGSYQLLVRRSGYRNHIETITLNPGKTLTRSIKLVGLPVNITIRVDPVSDARVSLNGVDLGKAPLTVQRPRGRYRLVVSRSGYLIHREWLIVVDKPIQRRVKLVVVAKPRRPGKKRSKLRLAAYITGGIGLGLLLGGGVAHALALRDRKTADDPTTYQVVARDKANSFRARSKLAYGLYALGGASLLTGIVLLVVDLTRKPKRSEKISQPRFRISPNVGGATLHVRF